MEAYRTEATVHEDGTVTVGGVPFSKGQRVEVILLGKDEAAEAARGYALRGEPVEYVDPFGSVAEGEWEAERTEGR
jgi:hypothetical protein